MLMRPASLDKLRHDVEALRPWFHNMKLDAIETAPDHPLGDYPSIKWKRFKSAIADKVRGRSVLDIGCNAGFYSIEMKRLGAKEVVGIDFDDRYLAQARLAAKTLGEDIQFESLSVYDVAGLGRQFDIVLFMGVLYHLRHPLLALDLIREHVAGDILVFQSMQRGSDGVDAVAPDYDFWHRDHFDQPGYPKLHFIEHSYAGDPTNWWVPNHACSEAMLRSAGFSVIEHPEQEVYICRRQPVEGHSAVYPARSAT
jgi:tRNA (mo5U34)-methyltransferase